MAARLIQPECAINARHVIQLFGWSRDRDSQGYQKSILRKIIHYVTKTLILLALSEKSVGIFFKFLIERSPGFECAVHDNGGLSKAHIARHSSPTPLVTLPSLTLVSFWSASTITAVLGKGPQFANPRVSQLPDLGAFTLSLGVGYFTN